MICSPTGDNVAFVPVIDAIEAHIIIEHLKQAKLLIILQIETLRLARPLDSETGLPRQWLEISLRDAELPRACLTSPTHASHSSVIDLAITYSH